jgi:hypothetical protein
MAEKYCTYDEAEYIAILGNERPPAVPSDSDIRRKLITKENLITYKCKVSNTAKINYTDKQCVLKKDVIPLSSGGAATITLSTEYIGVIDGAVDFAFYCVFDPGPFVLTRIDDYTCMYYPTNAYPYLFPYDNVTTHTVYQPIGGSDMYSEASGPGGGGNIDYVSYGLGISGQCEIYSHGTGNGIVYLNIHCQIYFFDGNDYTYSKRLGPSSTTIEYQDANETVYKHVFDRIYYNNIAGPGAGFIECGERQVKKIIATISIYGDA